MFLSPSCRICSGIHRGTSESFRYSLLGPAEQWTPEQVRGDGRGPTA